MAKCGGWHLERLKPWDFQIGSEIVLQLPGFSVPSKAGQGKLYFHIGIKAKRILFGNGLCVCVCVCVFVCLCVCVCVCVCVYVYDRERQKSQ